MHACFYLRTKICFYFKLVLNFEHDPALWQTSWPPQTERPCRYSKDTLTLYLATRIRFFFYSDVDMHHKFTSTWQHSSRNWSMQNNIKSKYDRTSSPSTGESCRSFSASWKTQEKTPQSWILKSAVHGLTIKANFIYLGTNITNTGRSSLWSSSSLYNCLCCLTAPAIVLLFIFYICASKRKLESTIIMRANKWDILQELTFILAITILFQW